MELLENTLSNDTTVDLTPLRRLLLALIEDGQRHTMHGPNAPQHGIHPCARKGRTSTGKEYIYCRYKYPKPLLVLDWDKLAIVTDDEHRPHLRNLHLARNDNLLNEYEEELLLDRGGNIDFGALINLWSVLEYLTKYNTKAGVGSKRIGKVLDDVLSNMFECIRTCSNMPEHRTCSKHVRARSNRFEHIRTAVGRLRHVRNGAGSTYENDSLTKSPIVKVCETVYQARQTLARRTLNRQISDCENFGFR